MMIGIPFKFWKFVVDRKASSRKRVSQAISKGEENISIEHTVTPSKFSNDIMRPNS